MGGTLYAREPATVAGGVFVISDANRLIMKRTTDDGDKVWDDWLAESGYVARGIEVDDNSEILLFIAGTRETS